MNTDQKLDLIISILQDMTKNPTPRKRLEMVAPEWRELVTKWRFSAAPGYHSFEAIATACNLPTHKRCMISIGRVLDELGVQRWRRNDGRGFLIPDIERKNGNPYA